MRPEELGFVVPCERCTGPLYEGLVEICRSYYDGQRLDTSAVFAAHGHLQNARGCGGLVGVVCGICGARWAVYDVELQFCTLHIWQESTDGRYYCSGHCVDGKRHGGFGYIPHPKGNERHIAMLFSEWWDHGRLVEWQEYGPSVRDAQGEYHSFVVHWWWEEDRYRALSMDLTVLWDDERVGRIGVTGRHVQWALLIGNFFPDANCAAKAPVFAEARRLLETPDEAACQEGADPFDAMRYQTIRQEIAEHVRFPELPIELAELRFEGEGDRVIIRPLWSNLRNYAYRHPPRCIKKFHPIPHERDPKTLIRHELTAYFQVSCPCGERSCFLLGHFQDEEGATPANIFVGPMALECSTCGRVSELIDTRQHGYDGEKGCDGNLAGAGQRVRFPCPQCGAAPMALFPGFSYDRLSYDPLDIDSRPQNIFVWFSLSGDCSGCGKRVMIADLQTKR